MSRLCIKNNRGFGMKYREILLDLFDTDYSYALAHFISADCKVGEGIAKEFKKNYPDMLQRVLFSNPKIGQAISYHSKGRMIFNLITKQNHFQKATYDTFTSAIVGLKYRCEDLNIKKIAFPFLGADLDGLDWNEVKTIIQNVFYQSDIEVLICKKTNMQLFV
ncbi:hypothetical protein D7X33_32110 [Butyricicoccus sp. 1XD8-22]|nr:hypothetical protein D7X33_32110 [Butyricicoccus sp. 1XD8-22]